MVLIIRPAQPRQAEEHLDMREEFERFLQEHNVKREHPSQESPGCVLLWDKGRVQGRLVNLPPRKQWEHLIKQPEDYPEGSITRILLERKAKRKTALQADKQRRRKGRQGE
jgi:hypothetical protein